MVSSVLGEITSLELKSRNRSYEGTGSTSVKNGNARVATGEKQRPSDILSSMKRSEGSARQQWERQCLWRNPCHKWSSPFCLLRSSRRYILVAAAAVPAVSDMTMELKLLMHGGNLKNPSPRTSSSMCRSASLYHVPLS